MLLVQNFHATLAKLDLFFVVVVAVIVALIVVVVVVVGCVVVVVVVVVAIIFNSFLMTAAHNVHSSCNVLVQLRPALRALIN